ncbi:MAG: hypothetical protein NDJ89_04705 [Oligoflexia bacterium]|nr:hypothetical protein [Oligoflexia bacterium]
MGKTLKITGSILVILACFMILGAIWGSAAERDPSVWTLVVLAAFLGLGLFAWGSRQVDQKAGPKAARPSTGRQLASGLILFLQLCTLSPILNFGIVILYSSFKERGFWNLTVYSYFLGSIFLFFCIGWLRRRIRNPSL